MVDDGLAESRRPAKEEPSSCLNSNRERKGVGFYQF